MTLTQFPRTSVFYPRESHFHKHNRRLGKVSREMHKIIEDIQGKDDEKTCRRRYSNSSKSARCGCRKRHSDIHLITNDFKSKECTKYHHGRVLCIRCREHGPKCEGQEMTDHMELMGSGETQWKLHGSRRNLSDRLLRSPEEASKTSDSHSLPPDENYPDNSKRSKVEVDDNNKGPVPWKRPLPPVPRDQTENSEAKIYENILEKVQARLKTPKEYQRTGVYRKYSPSITQVKGVAKTNEAKQEPNIVFPNVDESTLLSTGGHNCDDEHIYESIDDGDVYESVDSDKMYGLLDPFPRQVSDMYFRREDTYLQPFLGEKDIDLCSEYFNFSSKQRSNQISNRDERVVPPTSVVRSFVSEPLRATLV